jgi:uncharacterized coiled-coil protein SlyX
MKRLLLLALITVIGVIKISAQEIDMSQENSTDARIEELSKEVAELSQKLEKLQEDYEYLDLVNQLNDVYYDVEIFTNNVKIRTNEIVVRCYNSSFDIDLYLLDKDMYDQFQDFYDLYSHKRDELSKQISNLTFSNEKQYHINFRYDMLNSALRRLENSIYSYKAYLDVYKKLGKGF